VWQSGRGRLWQSGRKHGDKVAVDNWFYPQGFCTGMWKAPGEKAGCSWRRHRGVYL